MSQESEKTAEEWFNEGAALGRVQKNEESIKAYTKAQDLMPFEPLILVATGSTVCKSISEIPSKLASL